MLTLPHQNPIGKISWSPTRFGLLSTLTKGSSVVQLYDLQHAQWGKWNALFFCLQRSCIKCLLFWRMYNYNMCLLPAKIVVSRLLNFANSNGFCDCIDGSTKFTSSHRKKCSQNCKAHSCYAKVVAVSSALLYFID